MKTAGVVLDFYDDVTGTILKEAFPTVDALPAFVKEAHILNPAEREILRDEAYALVMQDEGKVIRKFACVDKGNTFLSMLYFAKSAELLPEEAREVAASNILAAAERYKVPTGVLAKTAAAKDEGKKGSGMGKTRDSLQQPLVGDEADWAARTNLVSVRGGADSGRVIPTANQMKTAAVDVTGKEPAPKVMKKEAQRSALGKYPLDSYADVRAAVEYFNENWPQFDPPDRHEFCVKVASRAYEIGLEVPELLARYGSTGYAGDDELRSNILSRKRNCAPDYHGVYDAMLEKKAELDPEQFAELLARADIASGLNWHWGGPVKDPWLSTFGPQEKTAFGWEGGGYAVDADALQEAAASGVLKGNFTDDIVKAFEKDPVAIFSSLPDDSKQIIARLATEA